jgi:hypothetical protein
MPDEFEDILSALREKPVTNVHLMNKGDDEFADILAALGRGAAPVRDKEREPWLERVKRDPKELLYTIESGFFPTREEYDPTKSDLENLQAHLRNIGRGAINLPFILPEFATGVARRVIGEPLERYIAGDEPIGEAVAGAGKAVIEEAKGFLDIMKMAIPFVNQNQWQEIFTHPEMVYFGAKIIQHAGRTTAKLTKANSLRRGMAEDALKSGDLKEAADQVTEMSKSQPEVIEDVSANLAERLRKKTEGEARQAKVDEAMPTKLEDTLRLKAQARQAEIEKKPEYRLKKVEGKPPTKVVKPVEVAEAIKPVETSMERLDRMVEEIKAVGEELGRKKVKETGVTKPTGEAPVSELGKAIEKLQIEDKKSADVNRVVGEIDKLNKLQDTAEKATGMNKIRLRKQLV